MIYLLLARNFYFGLAIGLALLTGSLCSAKISGACPLSVIFLKGYFCWHLFFRIICEAFCIMCVWQLPCRLNPKVWIQQSRLELQFFSSMWELIILEQHPSSPRLRSQGWQWQSAPWWREGPLKVMGSRNETCPGCRSFLTVPTNL